MNGGLFELLLCLWFVMLGACIASFINVVIYRLPKGAFLSKSRSFCPECGHTLVFYDLIPVISWLLLRGHCRYCTGRISARYPAIEAAGAAFALLCYFRYDDLRQTALAFGVCIILLAVAVIDFDTMEIPNTLILALVPFAALTVWLMPETELLERGIGFLAVSLPMLIMALIINGAFGGGDIKLTAVCGFLLGWKCMLAAFFIALLTGGIAAVYLLVSGRKKRGEVIAFGPYLCLGVFTALLWGGDIILLYLSIFNFNTAGW